MKRTLSILLAALLLVLGLSVSTFAEPEPPLEPALPYEIGSVTVISGGKEYEPYAQLAASAKLSSKGTLLEIGWATTPLAELFDTLPNIPYADDFQVVVDGKDAGSISYTLFNDKLETVVTSPIVRLYLKIVRIISYVFRNNDAVSRYLSYIFEIFDYLLNIEESILTGTRDVFIPEKPGVYVLEILVFWSDPEPLSHDYSAMVYHVKITR